MSDTPWLTQTDLMNLAFETNDRAQFRRHVMVELSRRTDSEIAVFGNFDRPLTAENVLGIDPSEAEAARSTVLSSPHLLMRTNERLKTHGVAVDTLLYTPQERERLPHVEHHQAARGVTSNMLVSWQDRLGFLVVLNLCRTRGRYSEEHERSAKATIRALAITDSSFPDDDHVPIEPTELTARQREIIELTARGLTNPEIALACGISKLTVRNHLAKLFQRFGVSTRTELVHALCSGARTSSLQFRKVAPVRGGTAEPPPRP